MIVALRGALLQRGWFGRQGAARAAQLKS